MARNNHPEETINKILDAAMQLFAQKGYSETSIQEITNKAGVSKGALYHHFESKEQIIDALGDRRSLDKYVQKLAEILPNDDMNALEKIKAIIKDINSDQEISTLNAYSITLLNDPKFLIKALNDNREKLFPIIYRLICEGIDDGSVHTNEPKFLAEAMLLLGNIWFMPAVFKTAPDEMLSKIRYLAEIYKRVGLDLFDEEMFEIYSGFSAKYANALKIKAENDHE